MTTDQFIRQAIEEDTGDGDHTSLACIPEEAIGRARLLVKEEGVIAGVQLGVQILLFVDAHLRVSVLKDDGYAVVPGDIVLTAEGSVRSILKAERLLLNCMQRMSGIATVTQKMVERISDTHCQVLDTRKTTPNLRFLEKWAVRIGGGTNHRFGLYDMIMIKDNHVDYAGGIRQALDAVKVYLSENRLELPVEIEVRSFDELEQALNHGEFDRVMLDNFSAGDLSEAIRRVDKRFETEASGGITIDTIREYALSGVDFISVGALTHSVKSLDLSLKAY